MPQFTDLINLTTPVSTPEIEEYLKNLPGLELLSPEDPIRPENFLTEDDLRGASDKILSMQVLDKAGNPIGDSISISDKEYEVVEL